MPNTRDIPGRIAKVLFFIRLRLGHFTRSTDFTCSLCSPKGCMAICRVSVAGYAVWFGWLWRSRSLPPRATAVGFWLCSFAINGFWPVFIIATNESWPQLILSTSAAFVHW